MKKKLWLIWFSLFSSTYAFSSINDYFPYKVLPSASNYGNTGIIELPNARFMSEAQLRFNFSTSYPNEYTSLTASPFNWFEATYRYTEIKNRKYGSERYSGNQTYKDKGFDVKFLLKKETYFIPAVAIGLRDIAGTGLSSSEYLVASKRFGKLDLSLGLGWGVLGIANNIENPLKNFDDSFSFRSDSSGQGGAFSFKDWFSGRTAILGGMELDVPIRGLRFKVEYDTTNPVERKAVDNVRSRFNVGVNYSWSDSLNFSTSFERGSTFRVAFKLNGNFFRDTIPKPSPKKVQSLNKDQKRKIQQNNEIFYRSLNLSLRDESIYIQAASLKEKEIDLAIASSRFYNLTRPIGRAARIAAALSPDEIERINIHAMNGDIEVAKVSFGKEYFEKADASQLSSSELLDLTSLDSNSSLPLYTKATFIPTVNFPEFNWTMSPALKHQIGGPEGFYLGQLFWKVDTSIKFRRNLLLYTSFGINIYDTFNDFNNPSQSSIPRVRSDIQDYLSEGKNNIQRMQIQYFASPFKDIFTRFDIGIMEEMFGGLGGEVLYRPFNRNFALGLSLHRVKQRGYKQLFSFREYTANTGHLGVNIDFPYGLKSQLSIGRYLAGDKGATLDLSRRFNSGFTLGVFATKTNLSAEEFGEGSFDKGFYISVPTKLFYSDFRSGSISFGLHPLTKDGGAILNKHNALISILGDSNEAALKRDWDELLK